MPETFFKYLCLIKQKNMEHKYTTVLVKGKDGITRPITKRCIDCEQYGDKMFLERYKKGNYFRRAVKKWVCSNNICKHSLIEESTRDRMVREGEMDEQFGILHINN